MAAGETNLVDSHGRCPSGSYSLDYTVSHLVYSLQKNIVSCHLRSAILSLNSVLVSK
jgi:hypothetical protein